MLSEWFDFRMDESLAAFSGPARGKYHTAEIKKLHDKYMGGSSASAPIFSILDYPELTKTIYSTDGKWLKVAIKSKLLKGNYHVVHALLTPRQTEFYHNNSALINGKITYHIFSTTDQAEHARMKRPIVKYYSQGAVLALEPHMDKVLRDLCDHLDNRFAASSDSPKKTVISENGLPSVSTLHPKSTVVYILYGFF